MRSAFKPTFPFWTSEMRSLYTEILRVPLRLFIAHSFSSPNRPRGPRGVEVGGTLRFRPYFSDTSPFSTLCSFFARRAQCYAPTLRGAPHSGFAAAILSTSVRTAVSVLGRPERVRVERHLHRRRSHWRCHRTTVSGCTTIKAVRHSRHALASRIQRSRSPWRSCGRLTVRVNEASC
jgi:hypothetical protein